MRRYDARRGQQTFDMNTIGFVGVGTMGAGMAANLLKAGFDVLAFDLDMARLAAIERVGARRGGSVDQLVASCATVLCSLPSSAIFTQVAEKCFLPRARPDQIFIDFGTTSIPETRRLAAALTARGAHLLDAPVSGNPRQPGLRVFTGGDAAIAERCRPIFEAQTEARFVVYCGPSGAGQIVKGVNQLAMGLVKAAAMEALAFGVASGVAPEVIAAAVGGDSGFRKEIGELATQAIAGDIVKQDAKFAEWPLFLEQGRAAGFDLPLTAALRVFCGSGECRWRDAMGRPYVSFWDCLLRRREECPASRSPDAKQEMA
jgi:3-hydroxyisobutyrate dehydrogenase-like beta-hydroxyacid dehydrogenase